MSDISRNISADRSGEIADFAANRLHDEDTSNRSMPNTFYRSATPVLPRSIVLMARQPAYDDGNYKAYGTNRNRIALVYPDQTHVEFQDRRWKLGETQHSNTISKQDPETNVPMCSVTPMLPASVQITSRQHLYDDGDYKAYGTNRGRMAVVYPDQIHVEFQDRRWKLGKVHQSATTSQLVPEQNIPARSSTPALPESVQIIARQPHRDEGKYKAYETNRKRTVFIYPDRKHVEFQDRRWKLSGDQKKQIINIENDQSLFSGEDQFGLIHTRNLHLAVLLNENKAVDVLSKDRSLLEEVDSDGNTPINCSDFNPEAALILAKAGANIFSKNHQNLSIEDKFMKSLESKVLSALWSVDSIINKKQKNDRLHWSITNKQVGLVENILDLGADPSMRYGSENGNALHGAVYVGYNPTIQILMRGDIIKKHPKVIEMKDKDGDTPINCTLDNPTAAKILTEIGANIFSKNNKGLSIEDKAVRANKPKILKALWSVKSATTDRQKAERLHWSLDNEQPDLLKTLLDVGADPTVRQGAEQGNVLHRAIYGRHGAAFVALTEESVINKYPSLLEMRDIDGDTPLNATIQSPKVMTGMATTLIERGANTDTTNNAGRNFAHHIRWNTGNPEITAIIDAAKYKAASTRQTYSTSQTWHGSGGGVDATGSGFGGAYYASLDGGGHGGGGGYYSAFDGGGGDSGGGFGGGYSGGDSGGGFDAGGGY